MSHILQWSSHDYTMSVNFFLDGPESVSIYPAKPVGVKGRAFTFTCSAVGHPQPIYWWILPTAKVYIRKILTLSNIQFADGGEYKCIARIMLNDRLGAADARVEFWVEGKMSFC